MASDHSDSDLPVLAMTSEADNSRKLRIWLPAIRAGSGADVFTSRLAEALEKAGHEPILQWFDHRYELMPWLLKRVEAPSDVDIVHAGSWQGFAFKRAGIPLVITEHQYVANPAFAPYRSLSQSLYHKLFCERWAKHSYRVAGAVVAVSEYCAAAMRVDVAESLTVIHNWVDCVRFSPARPTSEDRKPLQEKLRPFKLLFVGNPSRWKGADLLPSIAEELGSEFEIQCLGGLRANFDVKRLPANMKLLPQIEPTGMPAVYRAVDAALVPTRYEAFGYIALEAMACGLPVLGFDSSGTAEVCRNGETALLAKVDDVGGLASYARQLAGDRSLLARMSAAGRKRAIDYFDESKAVTAYLTVYKQVSAGKSLDV
jgi:glycosyltransferase involved in cell wall biosynthesis